ncbi:hypothetical protein SDRG_00177 [Saprolegnia diclina VS20]|uniref:receptor protein-tyrosine kinase n=1 Tax=Saprolegnia diclina (strain VS20) TaxID=1156394 RepID=T0SHG0_SAPDV|nr:hypothetical protein SDRG_00177 [Saprolegnia diclina VS20]EQC42442.1 hypothetical protein SDRG_00177 [Saprolegnia diclina VS20]|eukprot:XP_008603865.1 hypothetical protein SDRG_00177 [Saprolegnia diclina VS20]
METADARRYDVPGELAAEFTPNEADELSALFESADADGSGAIDEAEFKKLLVRMDIQVPDEEADKLVMAADTSGNGLVEWNEFVLMVLQARRGDGRFAKLKSLADALQMTPINLLQAEAERKATKYNPKTYLVSVSIAAPHDGGSLEVYETIGFSTREAKFKAAELALVKMRKMKPGYEFPLGTIPDKWDAWAFANLARRVKPTTVLTTLVQKGFAPATNLAFMKRLSVRLSSRRLAKMSPMVLTSTGGLPSAWRRWIDDQLARGMDGRLVLSELQAYGFDEARDLHTTQMLQRRPLADVSYDFWSCLHGGDLCEVQLFVAAGHDVNQDRLDRRCQIAFTPLQFAAKHGYDDIARFLLQHGAQVNAANSFRRTPLMFAARHGHPKMVQLLLDAGASIVAKDNLENTPLHLAAVAGCAQSTRAILTAEAAYMRACIVNTNASLCFLDEGHAFRRELAALYDVMMEKKLPRNVHRRFEQAWIPDAVDCAYERLFHAKKLPVLKPSRAVIDRVLQRYRYLQDQCPDALDEVERQRVEDARAHGVHNATHLQIYLEAMFKEAYKNAPNRQGRTALHLACDENLVCSHEAVLRVLLNTFGCDPSIRDHLGIAPLDVLIHRKGRPGSPPEDKIFESKVRSDRAARLQHNQTRRRNERDTHRRGFFESQLLQLLPMHPETNEIDLSAAKERSRVTRELAGWREYLDLSSNNSFYEHPESGHLTLEMPDAIKQSIAKTLQWYTRRSNGHGWTMHRDRRRARVFFFNQATGTYQWHQPDRVDGWVNTPPTMQTKSLDESDESDDDDVAELLQKERLQDVSQKLLRRLGSWEEHLDSATGGRVYCHLATGRLTREKPDEVLHEELKRQAYTLLIQSAQYMDNVGAWDKYYDETTKHVFYYNHGTGEGRHESEGNEAAWRGEAQDPAATAKQTRRLRDDELAKRKEQAEWAEALQRVHRRDIHATVQRIVPLDEHARRLQRLSAAIVDSIHNTYATHSVGYRDARIESELRTLHKAWTLGLFVSQNLELPVVMTGTREIVMAIQADEDESAAIEDQDRHPSLSERRRVERLVEAAIARLDAHCGLCLWGCHTWLRLGLELEAHEYDDCRHRLMLCRLGCTVVHEAHEWTAPHGVVTEMVWHEADECDTRLVRCPLECGMWVGLDQLELHTTEKCVRRPVSDLTCRLGCGKHFDGANNQILELEQERAWHEAEHCSLRIVKCAWPECHETMLAKDRKLHRRTHLCASGITTFKSAGAFDFVVPKEVKHIKIQAWGGGGGSGLLHGFKSGYGGGGAFVEGILPVFPGETLLLVVGGGGQGGVFGETAPSDTESGLPLLTRAGEATGGTPGGGAGYSGNNEWACGGGGGYSSVTRKGPHGLVQLLIAGGGGGGGCRDGLGGGGLHAEDRGEKSDVRNGRLGSQTRGGAAGRSSKENVACAFPASDGSAYQGGHGAEFGGGGGGGFFGGGGGGFSPGIVGGGGGGSSNVEKTSFTSILVERSYKRVPGGREKHPPAAEQGGIAGEGGAGVLTQTCAGNDGCIRIAIPGFYSDMDFDTEDDRMRLEPAP